MASFMIDDILKKEDLPKDHGKNETTTNSNAKQLKHSFRPLHKYHCIPQVKKLPSGVTGKIGVRGDGNFIIRADFFLSDVITFWYQRTYSDIGEESLWSDVALKSS